MSKEGISARNLKIRVEVGVLEINELTHTISFDFVLFCQWDAPGLEPDISAYDKFSQMSAPPPWRPGVLFFNLKSKDIMEETFFINKKKALCSASLNWILTISETLELERFPFDRQILKVFCDFECAIEAYPDTEPSPRSFPKEQLRCICDISNWTLGGLELTIDNNDKDDDDDIVSSSTLVCVMLVLQRYCTPLTLVIGGALCPEIAAIMTRRSAFPRSGWRSTSAW